MDRLLQDFRVAIRALQRHRTFSFVAIATLALGIGATTAIFSVVHGILLEPLPYVESDRLVALGQTAKTNPREPVEGSSSHVNFLDWQRESTTIAQMALYNASRAVITSQGESDVIPIGIVTPGFFSVFKAPPLAGRDFTRDEDRPAGARAVVISYAFWQERFGARPDVLSQSVEISGVPWPIVGVAPRGFDFPNKARLWMPVRNDDARCGRGCVYLNGIGRLADGASVHAARQEMRTIAAALEQQYSDNFDVTVMVQTLHERTVGSVQLALVILLSAVGMVLLIACANVGNLVLVRGASRHSEIAVRSALGAGRRGVVSYLLTENLVLALAGGVVGLGVATAGLRLLRSMAPSNLPRLDEVTFDATTFAFAAAIALATALIFGFGPSLHLARVPLSVALGQRGTIGSRRRWTRSLLLMTEVALSLVLLLGAGVLLRSLVSLQRTNPGFNADGLTVFLVSLPPSRYPAPQIVQTHERLDEQLGAMPGVSRVARISGLPLGPGENVLNFTRPDQPPPPPGQAPSALYRVVDAEYFDTMGIPMMAGRAFLRTDREGAQRVVIVNQRMANDFWPGQNPIGRPIQIVGQDPAVVVGVAADVRSQGLALEPRPEMYVPHAQVGTRSVMYVVKSTLPSAHVLAASRQVVRAVDSRLPLIFPGSMQALVDEQLARPRFYLVLLGLFAIVALVLAAVGLYGVVAYVVTERTREIGVRMALGAGRPQVIGLMLWQGLRPAAVGMLGGVAVAMATGRVMRGLLYEVRPHDPATFAGVTLFLFAVVVMACAIPAFRASRVPPAEALRNE